VAFHDLAALMVWSATSPEISRTMWKKRRETWRLKLIVELFAPLGTGVRMRINKSSKKEGHRSIYVHRKKRVRVWENLFLRTIGVGECKYEQSE